MTPPSSPEPSRRIALPDPAARWALGAAALTWAGVVAGLAGGVRGVAATATLGAVAAILRGKLSTVVLAGALVLGAFAGWAQHRSVEEILGSVVEPGPVRLVAEASTDPVTGLHGEWLVASPEQRWSGDHWEPWEGPPLLVEADQLPPLAVGETALIVGELFDSPGIARGHPYAARVRAQRVERLAEAENPLVRAPGTR